MPRAFHGSRLVAAAFVAATGLSAALFPAAASAISEPELTVRSMGAERLVLTKAEAKSRLTFSLPEGSVGASERWYLARLSATLRLAPSADGAATLVAMTNDRVVNQVELRAVDGVTSVFYNGYATGRHRESTAGRVITVEYENYVQVTGVKDGENFFTLVLDGFAGTVVDEAVVDVDRTAVLASGIHPEQLRLKAPVTTVDVPVNGVVRLPIGLERRGQRPDKPATMSFEVPPDLTLVDSGPTSFASVGAGAESYVEIKGQRLGEYNVLVSTDGGYNDPSARIAVAVVPARDGRWRFLPAAGLLVPGVWLLWSAVRREPGGPGRRRGGQS